MFTPINISKIVKEREVIVDEYPFEILKWCILKKNNKYHVGISSRLDEVKKRMTICHEIAHLEDDTIDWAWTFRNEWRAHKRAREMLVPCEAIKEFISEWFTDYATLASLFGVSEKMIQLRCKDLSIF